MEADISTRCKSMVGNRHSLQNNPRNFKHLVIHILLNMGCFVFNNVGAKDTIDLVVGIPKSGELRIAGIRIRTSSYNKKEKRWYFSENNAKYFIEKPHFFYVFCLEQKNRVRPRFIVISSADLKKMSPTVKNGNYAINIYEGQIKEGRWKNYLQNFEQIKLELEK